jgi:hypothetical protein
VNLNSVGKLYDRLTARERLSLAMNADNRGDEAERQRIMRHGTCSDYSATVLMNIMALHHVTRQLDFGFCYMYAVEGGEDYLDSHLEPDPFFEYLELSSAFLFATYGQGWEQFCIEMKVDSYPLVRGNYQGIMLGLATKWMPSPPTPTEFKEATRKVRPELPDDFDVVTAEAVRNSYLNILAEIHGFESLSRTAQAVG